MRLLAFDLDGTLLNEFGNVHPKNIEAIQKLKDNQEAIAIASGRTFDEMVRITQVLQLQSYPHAYLIGYNGVEVLHAPTKKSLYSAMIKWSDIYQIHQVISKYGFYLHVFTKGGIYLSKGISKWLDVANEAAEKQHFVDFETFQTKDEVYKALIYAAPEELDQFKDIIIGQLPTTISVFKSASMLIEFVSCTGTKGHSLMNLAKQLSVPRVQTYAFGDEENDLSMIQMAGVGIAMGNAKEVVKRAAAMITSNHTVGGVADGLYELGIIKP